MKYLNLIAILLFSSVILYSCKEEPKTIINENNQPQPIDFSNTQGQSNTDSAQNTAGVFHYTCSNGCAGGSASAGACANCGNTLAHNQAYHSNTNNTQSQSPFDTQPAAAETGQNAAGVWHYTCDSGCAGGSGTAGNCSNCGNTLAHNSAYHQ
ncbi:MAG: hypothetical protein HKM99_09750 [Flavobacteriaceae bacterium]|nr:hypothetical protein [Flavobacteriaceae bacterium]